MKNPIQPIFKDKHGILRFKKNLLVDALFEHGQKTGFSLNELAIKFNDEEFNDDRCQFAQLIGYSLSGYCDLSYVSDTDYEDAVSLSLLSDIK